ncbi:STAS domain-containing protein [Actinomadura fibrosa]|uniref:Anti-sigma factor antagonist n=1 Tax=Actinomadura fibrosa TaxID=111802 RepID=A0ABW2XG82_9ACTN|nr:STAS domain-containing protein [Actinomadura fibrosa]
MSSAAAATPPDASFEVSVHGGWAVVTVEGELDVYTAPRLEAYLAEALGLRTPPLVALEVSALRFCDSAGLNAFLRGWKRAQALGGRLVLVGPTGRLTSLLRITGLDQNLDILDEVPVDLSGER